MVRRSLPVEGATVNRRKTEQAKEEGRIRSQEAARHKEILAVPKEERRDLNRRFPRLAPHSLRCSHLTL